MNVYLTRDAASRRNIGTSKYHAEKEDGWTGRWVTRCSALLVADDSAREAAEVPEKNRRRTAACRGAWSGGVS